MSENWHTPGPWTFKRSPGGRKVHISGSNWFKFARVWVSVGGATSGEGLANAHLIACAPDLLDALREAKAFIEDEYRDPAADPMGEWIAAPARQVHARVCSAIAKAEGRS